MAEYITPNKSLGQQIFVEDNEELKKIQNELDGTYWVPSEIRIEKDLQDWTTMMSDYRKICENAIIEFNIWDILVMQVYGGGDSFVSEIQSKQLSALYVAVAAWEAIHSRSYSAMGMTLLGKSAMEKIMSLETRPKYISDKAEWFARSTASRYSGPPGALEHVKDHARRVVVNCAVEGLFFQPKFASILWIKQKGLMAAFCFANELISRDEGLHARLAAVYFRLLGSPLNVKETTIVFKEACELECAGVMETHPVGLPGLSPESLCQYVRHSCDFLLRLLHGNHVICYGLPNPYADWLTATTAPRATSFFEKDTSEYSSRGIENSKSLVIMEDF